MPFAKTKLLHDVALSWELVPFVLWFDRYHISLGGYNPKIRRYRIIHTFCSRVIRPTGYLNIQQSNNEKAQHAAFYSTNQPVVNARCALEMLFSGLREEDGAVGDKSESSRKLRIRQSAGKTWNFVLFVEYGMRKSFLRFSSLHLQHITATSWSCTYLSVSVW